MDGQEIEAKFAVSQLAPLRQRLLELGATTLKERHLERNWRFDSPDGRLRANHEVLRLRDQGSAWLTYKRGMASFEERREINLRVDDIEAARGLLEALGYQVVLIYEKYRQVFRLGATSVMIDELPFGAFVEIEGPDLDTIRQTAQELGLDWGRRCRETYMQLVQRLQRAWPDPPQHATFAEFEGRPKAGLDALGLQDASMAEP
jgi:adenylate cyclase class 2